MKAIIKATSEADSLEVSNLPTPEVGPGDVLVRVHASGICYTDSTILHNKYIGRKPVPIPMVLGHEAAGEIVEVGEGVPQERVGERVALEPIAGCGVCRQCLTGHQNMCANWEHIGITRDGTFAEYISLPSRQAHVIGEDVTYAVASMNEPFGLVVRTLEQVKPLIGETAAIIGPGSIGMLHLLALKASGLGKVIMVGLSADAKRFSIAEKLGADGSIAVDREDAVEAINRATNGAGADIVVETASSPKATQLAFEIVAPRGRISLFGLYPTAEFSPVKMLRKGVQAFGDVAQVTHHFVTASRIMASGVIDFAPMITHRFSLDQAADGFAAVREGEAVKVVFEA
jgi:threonine dehydrogenase-like Zn-dependent dehydrogenase